MSKERRQWMPWYQEPKKDAIDRDSRRVGANIRLSDGFRMGKPNQLHRWLLQDQIALHNVHKAGNSKHEYRSTKQIINSNEQNSK